MYYAQAKVDRTVHTFRFDHEIDRDLWVSEEPYYRLTADAPEHLEGFTACPVKINGKRVLASIRREFNLKPVAVPESLPAQETMPPASQDALTPIPEEVWTAARLVMRWVREQGWDKGEWAIGGIGPAKF